MVGEGGMLRNRETDRSLVRISKTCLSVCMSHTYPPTHPPTHPHTHREETMAQGQTVVGGSVLFPPGRGEGEERGSNEVVAEGRQ